MKAILITASNQSELALRYEVELEDYNDVLPIGYWLVTDFGENVQHFDTVRNATFELVFQPVGPIQNGWISIVKKEQI